MSIALLSNIAFLILCSLVAAAVVGFAQYVRIKKLYEERDEAMAFLLENPHKLVQIHGKNGSTFNIYYSDSSSRWMVAFLRLNEVRSARNLIDAFKMCEETETVAAYTIKRD